MTQEAPHLISFARSLLRFSYMRVFFCGIFILCFSLNGCVQPTKKVSLSDSTNKNIDQTITGNFSSQSALVFDSIQIGHFFAKYPNIKEYENDVRSFYRKRNFSFAWFEKGLLIEQAGNLSSRILNLENDGIYKRLTDYVAVNIPEFKLHVYHADSLLWSCNAVVGQTIHPTTLFYGEIKYVVFSPYWNIPPGILRNEIIPGMKKSSSYLANHHMEITGYQGGLPVVRQKPGPSNALGLVKFLFPNSYNIYLHDTPSKSLFNETSRAFSHGCIRIEEPAKLAAFLLNDMNEWNPEKITKAMHAGKERYVTLRNKVPVFISYFTAFIDRDNRLNFRRDIYNLDERLASMIISGEGLY